MNTPARRILAIGAHPDDIDIACAGTLARCVQRGDTVVMAVVCRGDGASSDKPGPELVAVRSREARASAAVLGAELIELGLGDGEVFYDERTRTLLTETIRRARPDVVITHFHSDYGADHNNTLLLAVDATLNATVKYYATGNAPPLPRIPLLYMMEPVGGYGFSPSTYVDITSTFEAKARMLACHKSQAEWMRRYGGMDFGKYIDVVARFRGYQCGVVHAEGFIPHPSFGHVACGAVLP